MSRVKIFRYQSHFWTFQYVWRGLKGARFYIGTDFDLKCMDYAPTPIKFVSRNFFKGLENFVCYLYSTLSFSSSCFILFSRRWGKVSKPLNPRFTKKSYFIIYLLHTLLFAITYKQNILVYFRTTLFPYLHFPNLI